MAIPRDLLEAWSRAEITRAEVARRLGRAVGFGEMLEGIHAAGLPLPRVPTDAASPGRRALAEVLARAG